MKADVVLSYSFATVPQAIRGVFERPTRFVAIPTPANRGYRKQAFGLGWPHPIRTALKKYAPDVEPLRVALLGFSESCHGLRNLLSSADGGAVDSVIAIDGIHTPYLHNKQVDPATMRAWIEFGKYAILNERLFVDTHSSVVPPNFASTTETAQYLWRTLTGEATSFVEPAMPDLSIPATQVTISGSRPKITGPKRTVEYPAPPWNSLRRARGLVVLGCKNNDIPRGTADHIYQAKYVLPMVIEQFLAKRWNNIDPEEPETTCFIGGRSKNWLNGFGVSASCAQQQLFDAPVAPVPQGSFSRSSKSSIWKKVGLGLLAAAGAYATYTALHTQQLTK